ncbi:hypothetical protein PTKIN_Ptkin18bG0018200 [Pterospermum kingtungense]
MVEGKDPDQWSRSHFSTNPKCDMLLNNLCETFNKYILEAMDKPILTMIETIRSKLMQRIAFKSVAADNYLGPLCPKIQKKVDKIILESARCWATHAGGPKYEVTPQETNEPILPPIQRKPLGRPHKNRRKEADEANPNLHKIRMPPGRLNCKKCGKSGHNIRTCKGEVGRNRRVNPSSGSSMPKLLVRRAGGTNQANGNLSAKPPATAMRWMPDGSSQAIPTQLSTVTNPTAATTSQVATKRLNLSLEGNFSQGIWTRGRGKRLILQCMFKTRRDQT